MEKLKLYLDTNMIHDIFVNQAKALKQGKEPETPKKFAFMLEHKDKLEFITSFLTKAEIVREMRSAHAMKPELTDKAWNEFLKLLDSRYIRDFKFDEEIVDIVSKIGMKLRTMINFFHLFITIRENAYFVSGDKQILEKIKEAKLYDKTLTYIELKELVSKHTHSSYGEF